MKDAIRGRKLRIILERERLRRGLSRTDFAILLGLSPSKKRVQACNFYGQILRGIRPFPKRRGVRLAGILNLTPTDLKKQLQT